MHRPIRQATMMLALLLSVASCSTQRPFDSELWLQGDPLVRSEMVNDLIDRRLLIGKSADDVRALLGAPDRNEPVSLSYKVDHGHVFGKSPWLYDLVVQLDDRGKVYAVREVD